MPEPVKGRGAAAGNYWKLLETARNRWKPLGTTGLTLRMLVSTSALELEGTALQSYWHPPGNLLVHSVPSTCCRDHPCPLCLVALSFLHLHTLHLTGKYFSLPPVRTVGQSNPFYFMGKDRARRPGLNSGSRARRTRPGLHLVTVDQ